MKTKVLFYYFGGCGIRERASVQNSCASKNERKRERETERDRERERERDCVPFKKLREREGVCLKRTVSLPVY